MAGDAYPPARPARRLSGFARGYTRGFATAIALPAALALGLAACSGGAKTIRPESDRAAAALYQGGHEALERGDFAAAVAQFRILETRYPNDASTPRGQLELIYAYYKQDETAAVLVTADRFIHDHPRHANLDYVHYLRGLATYNTAMASLGQGVTEIRPQPPLAALALDYFATLMRDFPASKYNEDAHSRMLRLQAGLAEFELATAKLYLSRGDYINAALHARAVVENYPEAGVKTEATTVSDMAYRMLNLRDMPAAGAATPTVPEDASRPDFQPMTPAVPAASAPSVVTAPAAPVPSRPEAQAQPRPEAITAASATAEPPAAPAGEAAVQGENWIVRQDANAYTVQLLSSADQKALFRFVKAHPLTDLAIFEGRREGFPWYSLIQGAYPDLTGARSAAAALPAGLQPWIRRMGEIQMLIASRAKPAG
jgi:outer membrane protein assembly factor BamD